MLRKSLAHLQAAEFLRIEPVSPTGITFKHALTHEVAYRSLLQERRRALHARIVEALEALTGDRLADHAVCAERCGTEPSPTVAGRGEGHGALGARGAVG